MMSFAEAQIKEWRATTAKERRLVEVRGVSEDKVEELLAAQGVISLPKGTPATAAERAQPIQVGGKPVSEMIIEERR